MTLLNDSIRKLNKVGPKTEELYNKLGVFSIKDLIEYYPRDYFIYEDPVSESSFEIGKIMAVKAEVISTPVLRKTSKGDIVIANVRFFDKLIEIIWFKAPYLRSVLKKNTEYIFYGKLYVKNNRYSLMHPKLFTVDEYESVKGRMLPVYGLTKGLTNKQIMNNVSEALAMFNDSLEYKAKTLPDSLEKKYNYPDYGESLNQLHFPETSDSFVNARRRFAYEEFFYFKYGMSKLDDTEKKINNYIVNDFSLADLWLKGLPFKPTSDQIKAIDDIKKDLSGDTRMERVLQGDVGSGKTLVSFYACLSVASAGLQSVVMAPTEVLASQHFNTFSNWVSGLEKKINVVLLTGSMKAKEKRDVYDKIRCGVADVIVGTHALIQEGLTFKKLALTVADEQHRFGVMQRTLLKEKGYSTHSLFMTATPIPRTLAILMFGNVSLSEIKEKPADRLPIKNCMIPFSKRNTAFNFIRKEIQTGHQAFIVCSMIEENEMFECENITDYIKTVREFFGHEVRVESLHGKMTAVKKDEIMQAFASHEIDILISTTVIEVGIDVPNATVMMVENSERFGLSQLHQLRGRVGRGNTQSYCIFVNGSDSRESEERIQVLVNSNDGFKIAKEDLRFRGPGDFFGVRQSGDVDFRFADIYSDFSLFNNASIDLEQLLSSEIANEDKEIMEQGLMRYNKFQINCI